MLGWSRGRALSAAGAETDGGRVSSPSFPTLPAVPDAQRGRSRFLPRYEDVAQDGRFVLTALTTAMGESLWRGPIANDPRQRQLLKQGIVPILTRLYLEGGDDSISATRLLDVDSGYVLAHHVDDRSETRLFLNSFATVDGVRGRTHMPHAEGESEPVRVGRVFAEHVFTRPWGDKDARKVSRFELEGTDAVPPLRHDFRPLPASGALPEGATSLDSSPVVDDAPIVFGLVHTDSNQHVNSLVYLSLFEEALVRRLSAVGRSAAVLARWAEIGYRKPCFAGERVRVRLSLFERAGEVGAVGAFVPESDPHTDRPYAWVRMGAR